MPDSVDADKLQVDVRALRVDNGDVVICHVPENVGQDVMDDLQHLLNELDLPPRCSTIIVPGPFLDLRRMREQQLAMLGFHRVPFDSDRQNALAEYHKGKADAYHAAADLVAPGVIQDQLRDAAGKAKAQHDKVVKA